MKKLFIVALLSTGICYAMERQDDAARQPMLAEDAIEMAHHTQDLERGNIILQDPTLTRTEATLERMENLLREQIRTLRQESAAADSRAFKAAIQRVGIVLGVTTGAFFTINAISHIH